jgi:hypothetical protein
MTLSAYLQTTLLSFLFFSFGPIQQHRYVGLDFLETFPAFTIISSVKSLLFYELSKLKLLFKPSLTFTQAEANFL